MLELEDMKRLLRYLEKMFYPLKKNQESLGYDSIAWVCSETYDIMLLHKQTAMVKQGHLAYFRYHAMHPKSYISIDNTSDKAAYDAAQRAIQIHIDRMKKEKVKAR